MTTTGYGDLSATNGVEMVYASVVMVIGKLLFGFILGSIVSTLANLETQKVLFENKLETIKVNYSMLLKFEWNISLAGAHEGAASVLQSTD